MRIVEDTEFRDKLFSRLMAERFAGGHPHQHELWPCVRKGAGARFLQERGVHLPIPKRSALLFLRGESSEAVIVHSQSYPEVKPVFVYRGVTVRPDWWVGDSEMGAGKVPFWEVKSTVGSSRRFLEIVRRGEFDLMSPKVRVMYRSYFEQCAIYTVATGAKSAGLIVHFLMGEYPERRKNCPDCGEPLGPFVEERLYRLCSSAKCGYKSYSTDIRPYILHFTDEEIRYYRREVFATRARQFRAAMKVDTAEELMLAAPGTPNFMCRHCDVGEKIGCPRYGEEHG